MFTIVAFQLDFFRSAVNRLFALCLSGVFCIVFSAASAFAQEATVVHDRNDYRYPPAGIYLPTTSGATALSAAINAQANYVAGMGDYLESASIARRNNALAAEQEMRNALQWVSTYFERRELNRAYRLKQNPGYLENEAKRQELLAERIDKLFQEVLRGDVTREINWLLHELSGMTLPYQYLPGEEAAPDAAIKLLAGRVKELPPTVAVIAVVFVLKFAFL